MIFELVNAPGIYQQLISIVLSELEGFTIAYLDNILILTKALKKYFQHLQAKTDKPGETAKMSVPQKRNQVFRVYNH